MSQDVSSSAKDYKLGEKTTKKLSALFLNSQNLNFFDR